MQRAFTLMELVVAIAMAGFIATAAVGAGMHVNRAMSDTRKRLEVWDESKRLEEALTSLLMESGGDPLTPAQAISVVNNGASCSTITGRDFTIPCNSDDRLTIVTVDRAIAPCAVTQQAASVVLRSQSSSTTTHGCSCPMAQFIGTRALLIPADGSLLPREVRLHQTTGNCGINAPGQGSNLVDGTLIAIQRKVIFTQPDTDLNAPPGSKQLLQWIDLSTETTAANNLPEKSEISMIADHVYSLHIALGYDSAPVDGAVLDQNSTGDEWLFNKAGDNAASFPPDQLRMVGVGIIVGAKASTFLAPAQVYDGPSVSPAGVYLVASQSKVALRNLNVSVP